MIFTNSRFITLLYSHKMYYLILLKVISYDNDSNNIIQIFNIYIIPSKTGFNELFH